MGYIGVEILSCLSQKFCEFFFFGPPQELFSPSPLAGDPPEMSKWGGVTEPDNQRRVLEAALVLFWSRLWPNILGTSERAKVRAHVDARHHLASVELKADASYSCYSPSPLHVFFSQCNAPQLPLSKGTAR